MKEFNALQAGCTQFLHSGSSSSAYSLLPPLHTPGVHYSSTGPPLQIVSNDSGGQQLEGAALLVRVAYDQAGAAGRAVPTSAQGYSVVLRSGHPSGQAGTAH